jgi:hypothetical protein
VKGNTVSGDNYTPTGNIACGLLFYQAAGAGRYRTTTSSTTR